MDNLSTDFINSIKLDCGITWEDDDTNSRINVIINNALEVFKNEFGVIDIENYGLVRTLFTVYCRYDYYDMLENFRTNYSREIIQARMMYEVSDYESGE